jgi:hypothetical protein
MQVFGSTNLNFYANENGTNVYVLCMLISGYWDWFNC